MPKRGIALAAALVAGAGAGAWVMHRIDRRPDRVERAFHLLFHKRGAQTYNNTRWLGATVQKSPFDLWVFQEILAEIKPDVIVEAGTFKGGSSYYYATLFDLMGKGRVITVDIEDYPGKPKHPRVEFLLGSSTAPEIVAAVKQRIKPGETVMVFLDSDHTGPHVARELDLYHSLVTPGSYLIVEDTHFNGHPILPNHGPGPWEAVDAFLPQHPEFELDRSREKYGMTFNPRGFLRRVR